MQDFDAMQLVLGKAYAVTAPAFTWPPTDLAVNPDSSQARYGAAMAIVLAVR
jgi:hypothetical protein